MFRVSEDLFLGAAVAYEESASEGPGSFLGGAKIEYYPKMLSGGSYLTSLGISVLAGASGINTDPGFAAQLNAELCANFVVLPAFALGVGPMVSLRLQSGSLAVLPGVTFSLKEGTPDYGKPLVGWGPKGPHVSGYWQGLWTFVNDRGVFIDGGGTRVELRSGLAFGITGGVLRQRLEQGGSDLAIMLTGLSAEWNWHPTGWLTVAPRLVSGLALYGWVAPDETLDGRGYFMIRPELCAFLGVFPFLQIGGGVGYQFIVGEPTTAVPLDPLSSLAFSIQVRVGPR
jgi:hypothetical protein